MNNVSFINQQKEIISLLSDEQIVILIKKLFDNNKRLDFKTNDSLINFFYNQIIRNTNNHLKNEQ
jgi:hypothetical protein